jgi:hypothetical protein
MIRRFIRDVATSTLCASEVPPGVFVKEEWLNFLKLSENILNSDNFRVIIITRRKFF